MRRTKARVRIEPGIVRRADRARGRADRARGRAVRTDPATPTETDVEVNAAEAAGRPGTEARTVAIARAELCRGLRGGAEHAKTPRDQCANEAEGSQIGDHGKDSSIKRVNTRMVERKCRPFLLGRRPRLAEVRRPDRRRAGRSIPPRLRSSCCGWAGGHSLIAPAVPCAKFPPAAFSQPHS